MEASISQLNHTEHFINYFHDIWKEGKPICKLFRTDTNGYLYDTGTNKILGCEDFEYNFFEKLLLFDVNEAIKNMLLEVNEETFINTAQSIVNVIEKERILLTKKAAQFGRSSHFHNFEELINTSLGMIQLETTESCNLRCDYCIYHNHVSGIRNYGKRHMEYPVAYAAIDYLAEHSSKKDDVAVTFYGGEPLLRFPFIMSCVEYARRKLKDKKEIIFSMTTNATLLTPQIAEYLFSENNFSVLASIDGPKEIHDDYRKDIRGNGSFERALNGLNNLYNAFGKSFVDRVCLSMVYTPPYSEKKLNRILELWEENPWIPSNIRTLFTYPHRGSITPKKLEEIIPEDKSLKTWAKEKYLDNYINNSKLNNIAEDTIKKRLVYLFQRPIFSKPVDNYHLNGCCIPGVRKIFVTVDGNFNICERISGAPSIGNVYSGLDIEKIKKIFINEYSEKSLPLCSECWAIQLCRMCYTSSFNNDNIDMGKKLYECNYQRAILNDDLKYYCKLLEQNPDGLYYLSEIKID